MHNILILTWALSQLATPHDTIHYLEVSHVDGPAYVMYKPEGGAWDTLGFVPGPHIAKTWELRPHASMNDSVRYVFPDPIAWAQARQDADGLPYPADNDPLRLSPHLRKPGIEFGWDFARRHIQTGGPPPRLKATSIDDQLIIAKMRRDGRWFNHTAGYVATDDLPSQRGVRTVELIQDDSSRPFHLKVNDHHVFMLGVNAIVPHDEQDQDHLRKRIIEMWESGGNTVRFWGGGYYATDRILNTCDSLGVMVWHDFSYAGTAYPGDPEFRQWAQEEAVYQVRRLTTHPSVVILCGNNEIDIAWKAWGWQKTYQMSPEDSATLADNNHWLFEEMLPQVIEKHATQSMAYISSSPTSNWGRPEDFKQGNNHDWRVWHGEQPSAVLTETVAPFISEWGVPSLPGASVRARWDRPVEEYMLSYKGLALLERYLAQEMPTHPREHIDDFAYTSQLWQATVVERTIQAQADSRPFCAGSLLWQLNDVDDVISWSLIDSDDQPKLAWEAAKRAWRNFNR